VPSDRANNAGALVGERDGEDVVVQPLLGRLEARLEAGLSDTRRPETTRLSAGRGAQVPASPAAGRRGVGGCDTGGAACRMGARAFSTQMAFGSFRHAAGAWRGPNEIKNQGGRP